MRGKAGRGEEIEEVLDMRYYEIKTVFIIALLLGIFILLYSLIIPKYILQKTVVSGTSMEKTLKDHDSIFVDKLSYRWNEPKRFDLVVFYHFFDKTNCDKDDVSCYDFFVKRIIALPGETVQIKNKEIYINGQSLKDTYASSNLSYAGLAKKPILLGEDEYFVLGDNLEVSEDSRYTEVRNIEREDILGKACFRIFPLNKVGFLCADREEYIH